MIRSEKKGLVWFTVLKYAEVAITALTTFILAKQIGPKEMGFAMPVLIYITYVNYLSLGINQVVIKNYGRLNENQQTKLLTINFQYLLFAVIISIILAYLCLDKSYALLAGLVSAGSLFRSYFMSYFRVIEKMWVLNVNNILFSLALLFSTFFLVTNLSGYLFYWALSFAFGLGLYFFSDKIFFKSILKNVHILPSGEEIKFNLSEGIKLAAAGFITTLLLTADRLVINRLNVLPEIKGAYQLGDYAATAYYLFFTTVLFYFYPRLIAKLRTDESFRKVYLRYLKLSLLILPFIIVIIYFIGILVSNFIFPEYPRLEFFILCSVILKTCVAYTNLLSVLYIALDFETRYIKTMIPVLIGYSFVALFYIIMDCQDILFISLMFSLILGINFIIKSNRFERN